jgi:uncharacterized protein YecE (DUF72 family)
MARQIRIGTCGFRGARSDYYELLECVEVQHTFYQPPAVKTLDGWRQEAPEGFVFAIKAWQLITHTASSPTYKRLKRSLSDDEASGAGAFRDSAIVREAWEATRACAAALDARAILFQCPASFRPTEENIDNLRSFFGRIERDARHCCWEPRGAWDPELLAALCEELDLWHVVDPFAAATVTPERCYHRLHGRTGWRYQYEEDELGDLVSLLPDDGESFVFFNNIRMIDDAVRFRTIVDRA